VFKIFSGAVGNPPSLPARSDKFLLTSHMAGCCVDGIAIVPAAGVPAPI